jgi:phosphatidylinositol alpha-mannosyltransferase
MKIALVTEFFYPHLGGVTEHVHHLASQFRLRGHQVTIVTSRMGGPTDRDGGVRRVGRSCVLLSNGSFARVTVGWNLEGKVRDILREVGADVLHVQGALAPTLGLVAPQAAARLGIPVVGTFHSWFRRSVAYGFFRRPLQRRMDTLAAKIAVSAPVVQALSRYFRAEWEIIPNGVPTEEFHPNGRRPPEEAAEGPRLLFLGRLDPRNGLSTLLRAMPAIFERHPRALLEIVGDGPLRAHYERQVSALRGSVRFAGRIYEERPAYYAMADLYVCPTNKASFGITLLEAMACGTPIVASDITGFRELVDGGPEALLVDGEDPAAWARAVLELIDDPRRRARMGAAGLEKAARYSWSTVADQVLRVYERVAR